MIDRIVAFDVETPNARNDKICSIGITVLENDKIVKSKEYLIDPGCDFDARNVQIHGISQDMVSQSPCFPAVWDEIKGLFSGSIVAAHNASFDLNVLQKVFASYEIDCPDIDYICTLQAARAFLPNFENHKLNTLCDYYNIPLNHHSAVSDSQACACLLMAWQEEGFELSKLKKNFSFKARCGCKTEYKKKNLSLETEALLTLKSIIDAILADGTVSEQEVAILALWMNEHQYLRGNYPFDKIFDAMMIVLQDGILEKRELDFLHNIFKQTLDPVKEFSCKGSNLILLGKTFCLSGEFNFGSKNDVAEYFEAKGAVEQKSVSKKTDYLFVGEKGNAAWSAGNYGTKVKKAMELQEKGSSIQIIREQDYEWC